MFYLKKYFTMLLSVVLIISSIFFVPLKDDSVKSGKGNGKDAEVTNISELTDVLNFIVYRGADKTTSGTTKTSKVSFTNVSSEADEDEKINPIKHSSVTMYIDTVSVQSSRLSVDRRYTGDDLKHQSLNLDLNKKMTVYMTADTAYYKSKGIMSTTSIYDVDIKEYTIAFDVEIYLERNSFSIKINKFDINGDTEFEFSDEIFGKWLTFKSEDEIDVFEELDLTNRELLSEISEAISKRNTSMFIEAGGIFSLDQEHLKEFLKDIFSIGFSDDNCFFTGEFTVDLSNSKRPSINTWTNGNYSVEHPKICTQSGEFYSYCNIRFENIDNTVIEDLGDDVEIITDPKDFEKKYIISMED